VTRSNTDQQIVGPRILARIAIAISAVFALVVGMSAVADATGATSAAQRRPAVLEFSVSPATVPSAGGRVTLTATVAHAATCTLAATPAVPKLPAKLGCARGQMSKAVWLDRSESASPVIYHFKLTVDGPGGTAKSQSLSASVAGAPPAITGLVASPAGLPSRGGATRLTAKVERSSTCTLTSSPEVTGLPSGSFPCAAGPAPKSFTQNVALPALTGSSAASYTFTLTVTGPNGKATSLASQTVNPPLSFAAPVSPDQPAGGLDSVSCATAMFCAAIDRYGNVASFDGTGWSALQPAEPLPAGTAAGMATAISCPKPTFCAAVDSGGSASTMTSGTWSAATQTGLEGTAISCASTTSCLAVGGLYAASYTGTGWSVPVQVSNGVQGPLVAVSCPTASFCVAVTADGIAYTFTGTAWSSGSSFDSDRDVVAVSCHSPSLCVAVDLSGNASVYNGSAWSAPASVVGKTNASLAGIACPMNSGYCLASASNGWLYSFNGSSWELTHTLTGGPPGALSCSSRTTCAVIGSAGFIWLQAGPVWKSTLLDQAHGFLTSVSCPSNTFCAAVDRAGSALTYEAGQWSAPAPVESGAPFLAVSCPSVSFCMAIDAGTDFIDGSDYYIYKDATWVTGGFAFEDLSALSCTSDAFCLGLTSIGGSLYAESWDGKVWSDPELVDSDLDGAPGAGYVSCASKTFCVVVDEGGDATIFDDAGWSTPAAVTGAVGGLAGVSCPNSGFCTAVDGSGNAFTFNGKTWSAPVPADSDGAVTGVSCPSADFCALADGSGNIVTDYDGTWSAPLAADPAVTAPYGFTGISCPVISFCAAVDYDGNEVTGTG
jgi:hypothetical protein